MSRSKWEADGEGAPVGLQVRVRESQLCPPPPPPPPHPPPTAAALHMADWSGMHMLLVDAALPLPLCPGVHKQQHTHAPRCRW